MSTILNVISGEWMLSKRGNSGGVVLARSSFVSLWLFLALLGVHSYLGPCAQFSFSRPEFLAELRDRIPWLGAIFGGVYAALYSRFSSQWKYLAQLYNQLMAAEDSRPRSTLDGEYRKRRMMWWHAFIMDAQDVHLALKATFVGAVHSLLAENEIIEEMCGQNDKDKKSFDEFKEAVRKAADR